MTIDQSLHFIVFFAQLNLSSLRRQRDWARLREDFTWFCLGEKGAGFPPLLVELGVLPSVSKREGAWYVTTAKGVRKWEGEPVPRPFALELREDWPEQEIEQLQADVRALLNGENEDVDLGAVQVSTLAPVEGFSPQRRFLTLRGTRRDIFLWIVALTLTRPALQDRLRKCPAPHARKPEGVCGQWFVRVRKQLFCGKVCKDRVAKRAQRDR